MTIDKLTDEQLAQEGDGLLLQAYQICICETDKLRNRIDTLKAEKIQHIDRARRIEKALGKKHSKGANLIYGKSLVQITKSTFSANEMVITVSPVKMVD